jgi:nucleoside-diphosphate-sugar epimerase
MRVFVAGASGTIGVPLVRALVAAGHDVVAMTRTAEKQPMLRSLGATPVVADALDADGLRTAVIAARPTHVIHQLTALPKAGPKRASELIATNRLRDAGTRHLLAAAIAARASRFIGGSFAPFRAAPADARPDVRDAVDALKSMESQIVEASRSGAIDGIVLRYGLFYGPGTPSTDDLLARARRGRLFTIRNDPGLLPFIHIDDAVNATVMALDHGQPGGTYDIVDDRPMSFSDAAATAAHLVGRGTPRALPMWVPRLLMPYQARLLTLRVPLSNAAARNELGWRPQYPSVVEGLSKAVADAA